VPFQELVFRDIHIKGTLIAGQEYSQQMLNDAAKHGVKVETNIFNGLDEVPKMIELAHSGKMAGKAVSTRAFGANSMPLTMSPQVCVVDKEEFDKEKAAH
jgi:D-arabinose 1-dehydrogenase-like Zn-dependent alcohol dehydrogenase